MTSSPHHRRVKRGFAGGNLYMYMRSASRHCSPFSWNNGERIMLLLTLFAFFVVRQLQWQMSVIFVQAQSEQLYLPGSNNDEHAYQFALTTIRCLTTPGCFPSVKCRSGKPPKKIARGKRWEQHSFCIEDLQHAAEKKKDDGGCLVYSIGIHTSTEWEEKVARLFGCEVHAFDPTVNHAKNLAPGVTFHKLGLQGEGTDMSATRSAEYGAIDPTLLLSLTEIMERLGHTGRSLDVLMMDCEGCEWGVLKQLACQGESSLVEQLVVETHFQKNLGLHNEADVFVAADAINCLEQGGWSIASIEESGCSPLDVEYTRGVTKVVPNPFALMYITLQRMPKGEALPFERMEAYANAVRLLSIQRSLLVQQYGNNVTTWPEEPLSSVKLLEKKTSEAREHFHNINQHRGNIYDEHEIFEEK